MAFLQQRLSTGWTFKDRDSEELDAWMPVPTIPSTVQQDLIANNKLDTIPSRLYNTTEADFSHDTGSKILI